MTGEPDPHWPRDTARALAHEWREFFLAVWAFTRAPRQVAADWAGGKREILNPALYTLNAIALQTPWTLLWNHLAGRHEADVPLWSQALSSLSEFFSALIWTLPLHFIVRLLGGRRPLRTTYAATLYVTAGPLTMLSLLLTPLLAFGARVDAKQLTPSGLILALLVALTVFATMVVWALYSSLAVAGAHRLKLGRVVAATTFVLISALLFMGWFGIRYPVLGHALGMAR